jgi:hypothetical protein
MAEVSSSSCKLEVADYRKKMLLRNLQLQSKKKIAELRLRKRFLDVAEFRLQTLKKLGMPISALGVLLTYPNLRKPICLSQSWAQLPLSVVKCVVRCSVGQRNNG